MTLVHLQAQSWFLHVLSQNLLYKQPEKGLSFVVARAVVCGRLVALLRLCAMDERSPCGLVSGTWTSLLVPALSDVLLPTLLAWMAYAGLLPAAHQVSRHVVNCRNKTVFVLSCRGLLNS